MFEKDSNFIDKSGACSTKGYKKEVGLASNGSLSHRWHLFDQDNDQLS